MIAIPKFTDLNAAFGAEEKDYPKWHDIPQEFHNLRHLGCEIASQIFFKGGRLSDYGVQFKPGVDQNSAMRAIRAWLCSFAPKHEVKIATVGMAISDWCESYQKPLTEHKAAQK